MQSCDGSLSFFAPAAGGGSGAGPSFTCQLPGCLLPGPLCYAPGADLFVTSTSGGKGGVAGVAWATGLGRGAGRRGTVGRDKQRGNGGAGNGAGRETTGLRRGDLLGGTSGHLYV